MAWILGGIALTVALAALWLTTEAQRKFAQKLEIFVNSHVMPLRHDVSTLKDTLNTVKGNVGTLEKDFRNLKTALGATSEALADIRRDLEALERDQESLRSALKQPPQARAR